LEKQNTAGKVFKSTVPMIFEVTEITEFEEKSQEMKKIW